MVDVFDIVIFGGGGDLSQRKLLPALYRAYYLNELPQHTRIITTCRNAEKANIYRHTVVESLQSYLNKDEFSEPRWQGFKQLIFPIALDITQRDYQWEQLHDLLGKHLSRRRIYYLAVPPALFGICCKHLHESLSITDKSRLVVEKPLGYNAVSAEAINSEIASYFPESCIYRIDHYLGKETVQNLLALRFSNFIFEQLWDAKSIDHVQISISETVGLEGRAGFYDEVGALRDMLQNHLLQLLCLIAMEPPNKMNSKTVQAEKIKVLEALRVIKPEEVNLHCVRGQYCAGVCGNEKVPAYLQELGQNANDKPSDTETFVALRVYIDNWRWSQVPFYLRTGKRLKSQCAEIVIQFKAVSHQLFDEKAGAMQANKLVIRLQPEETMELILMAKNMDRRDIQLQPASLNLNFTEVHHQCQSDAYKRLILDAVADKTSLFIHRREVQAAWLWIDPIIAGWQKSAVPITLYPAGSWGPIDADELLARDHRYWFNGGEV
ncbi:MAG: glucose-6-phosphate dehydrogenase [Pseudomonadales bacterium]|nr:glucose-6-phosphate dehydrogenase [Pseudomonadales bacterium]